MLKIAVCDDTKEECALIVEYTSAFFTEQGREVHIDIYGNGTQLLESGTQYDLYLLDVMMPGITGIETAATWETGAAQWFSSPRPWKRRWMATVSMRPDSS